jgi:Uma2 family endonuclease
MSVAERPSTISKGPRRYRWTRAQYHRAGEAGLFVGQRVQLVTGEIILMSPQGHPHAVAIGLVEEALRTAFGRGFWPRVQLPLALGKDDEPEPDVAVVAGSPRSLASAASHPTTALLVVEVADTSLAFDRDDKGPLYAAAGVPEYWIVNLVDRQLEVLRDPKAGRYSNVQTLNSGERIRPIAAPTAEVSVADLLP